MRITAANHSALPYASDAPDDAAVMAALQRQVALGLDVITDGQPGWRDPFTPLLTPLAGVRLGAPVTLPLGLSLAARPIVESRLRRHHAPLLAAYRRVASQASRPVKVTLTGPYTLAQAAEVATTAYRHREDLAADLAMLLAQEVAALVTAGAAVLQIDEPLLLADPGAARVVRTLLEPLYDAALGSAMVLVSVYGADAGAVYAQLNTLPGDVIAVDCAGRPETAAAIAATGSGKPLALGIVDGRAPHIEPVAALARTVEPLLARYAHDTLWLQPACGLGGVDAATADAALALVGSVAAALRGSVQAGHGRS